MDDAEHQDDSIFFQHVVHHPEVTYARNASLGPWIAFTAFPRIRPGVATSEANF